VSGRQDEPSGEIAALDDEAGEALRAARRNLTVLLDLAYKARIDGEAIDRDALDHALRSFMFPTLWEVAESVAAYADQEQEALLDALTPEAEDERRVWWSDRVDPAVGGYHAGAESSILVSVSDGAWVVRLLPGGDGARAQTTRGRLLAHVIAGALGTSAPTDEVVRLMESLVLVKARELARVAARDGGDDNGYGSEDPEIDPATGEPFAEEHRS
jgi:hypothetical protein